MTQQLLHRTADQISTYHGRTWEQFKLIQKGLEDLPGVRLSYYDGTLEILMPGQDHEIFKSLLGSLLEAFFFDKKIRIFPTGSMTQEHEEVVSAQADESYCIGERKPIPDLSIEVVFTSGGANKLRRYRALGVPEVWFWQDGVFRFYRLRRDGYEQIDRSEIPELATLDVALLSRCMILGETDWLAALTEFRNGMQA